MTTHDRDKIIAAAKEAGIYRHVVDGISYRPSGLEHEQIERFYAIAHEDGRQAEKDACIEDVKTWWAHGSESIINTIRARGDMK